MSEKEPQVIKKIPQYTWFHDKYNYSSFRLILPETRAATDSKIPAKRTITIIIL